MADAKTEKQKVKEITDKLEEGLKELFESEKYKSYLSTMSKFHNYSFNNTLLIALQRPDATLVAGYQAWQKNFNRHVKKGERGIRILAPAPYRIKEERDKLKDIPEMRQFQFAGTESLKRRGIIKDNLDAIKPENYNLVYVGELFELQGRTQSATLEAVYEKFNIDHPADYKGHSLSVSDIVVLHEDGKNSAHFVDSFGFTGLPDFMRELEGIEEPEKGEAEPEAPQEETLDTSGHNDQKSDAEKTEQKSYPDFYGHTLVYAMEHGEVDRYLDSRKLDRECKEAVEGTIRQNFDGMHLKHLRRTAVPVFPQAPLPAQMAL